MPKKVTLEVWRRLTYGDGKGAPHMATLRRWIAQGLIHPPPQKEGRSFYLSPDARYVDPRAPTNTLLERLNATAPRRS